jgi:hypothetical protein
MGIKLESLVVPPEQEVTIPTTLGEI